MITIEVLESSNFNRLGRTTYYKNSLKVGRHISNDIIIENSPEDFLAKIEIEDDGKLYFIPLAEYIFHINRNKTNSKKLITTGDSVSLFETKIKLAEVQKEPLYEKSKILSQKLAELKEQKSPFLKVLKALKDL